MGLEPVKVSIADLAGRTPASGKREDAEGIFPYRDNSIYEPVARPVVVIRPAEECSSEEKLASDISRLSSCVSDLCSERSLRILSAFSVSDRICLLLEGAEDAWKLSAALADLPGDLPALSLLLHAGLAMMLDSSMTGRRDYYCREMNEAVEASGSLSIPGQLVTMQFRAMLRHSTSRERELDFKYHGLVMTTGGDSLRLFRIR
ncbi:MAG: hypothetical protein AVO35_01360 [Candidatus Aegiribacteria sp. MLS_C]|nr:MAG: hypothetical protein AVO35_01360 [Candidatus Aegiribacteria sp. MLS_C]